MEEGSHLSLMAMALLQTCGYVIDQMQSDVTIDVNKFLEAFSIQGDSRSIRPPSWTKTDGGSVAITPNTSLTPPPIESSFNPSPFNMDDYRKCRQSEALRWIDLQEKRASIIAHLRPISAEEYQEQRNAILTKPEALLRKQIRKTGLKYSYINQFAKLTSVNFFQASKQIPRNKTDGNMSKTLQGPSDFLVRR